MTDPRRYVMTIDDDPEEIECTWEELAPQVEPEALDAIGVGEVLGVGRGADPMVQIRRIA